jgi:hypothetical protein
LDAATCGASLASDAAPTPNTPGSAASSGWARTLPPAVERLGVAGLAGPPPLTDTLRGVPGADSAAASRSEEARRNDLIEATAVDVPDACDARDRARGVLLAVLALLAPPPVPPPPPPRRSSSSCAKRLSATARAMLMGLLLAGTARSTSAAPSGSAGCCCNGRLLTGAGGLALLLLLVSLPLVQFSRKPPSRVVPVVVRGWEPS